MKKRTSSLPVLVIVAVVALVVGSLGTATAADLTRGQVKRIAKQVVKKKAHRLTVANADALGGVPASVYQDRVAFARITAPTALGVTGPGIALASATITVPAGVNLILIEGDASYFGGATIQSVWWDLDGACAATAAATNGFGQRSFTDTTNTSAVGSATTQMVLNVAAGAHTVRLCGRTNAPTTVEAAELSVQTIANGSAGGPTLRPSGDEAQARPDDR
jgi:hypothetical protein